MSIKLMTDAWKSDLPTGQKMVLLALCDSANDQGECYPSISTLVEKCSMSERSVFNHIDSLEKNGAISRQNRAGRSTFYTLNPCKFCTPANSAPLQPLQVTPANSAPTPANSAPPVPANSAPITVIEPSLNRQGNSNSAKSSQIKAEIFKTNDVDPNVWQDFVALRKTKKAPITATAIDGIRREAEKAGLPLGDVLAMCCARGWTGFKADWHNSNAAKPSSNTARQSVHRFEGAGAAIFEGATHV